MRSATGASFMRDTTTHRIGATAGQTMSDRMEPLNHSRSEHDERMTVFGYYANMAANLIPDEKVAVIIEGGHYRDPREVLREIADWCYGNRDAE